MLAEPLGGTTYTAVMLIKKLWYASAQAAVLGSFFFQMPALAEHTGAAKDGLRPEAENSKVIDFSTHAKSTASCALAAMIAAVGVHGAVATVKGSVLAATSSTHPAWMQAMHLEAQGLRELIAFEIIASPQGIPEIARYGVPTTPPMRTPLNYIGLPGFVEGCKTMYRNVVQSFTQLGQTLKQGREQRVAMGKLCASGQRGLEALPKCLRGCGVTGAINEWPSVLNQHFSGDPAFGAAPLSTNPVLIPAAMGELHSAAFNSRS